MEQRVVFSVPCGIQRTETLLALNERVQATGKNIQIQAYDTVQGLRWNGGRILYNQDFKNNLNGKCHAPISIQHVETAIAKARQLNDAGIPFNLVFNNTLANLDVNDEVGNYLLDALHNELNKVTIASPILKRHISTRYPEYQTTASICFAYRKPEEYKKLCAEYDLIVALPHFAYQMDRLAGVPLDKLSFIINDDCYLMCQRTEHYAAISRCCMKGNTSVEEQKQNLEAGIGGCFMLLPHLRPKVFKGHVNGVPSEPEQLLVKQRKELGLTTKDLEYRFNITPIARRNLIAMGIRNFKLQGREANEEDFQVKVIDFLERVIREEF